MKSEIMNNENNIMKQEIEKLFNQVEEDFSADIGTTINKYDYLTVLNSKVDQIIDKVESITNTKPIIDIHLYDNTINIDFKIPLNNEDATIRLSITGSSSSDQEGKFTIFGIITNLRNVNTIF